MMRKMVKEAKKTSKILQFNTGQSILRLIKFQKSTRALHVHHKKLFVRLTQKKLFLPLRKPQNSPRFSGHLTSITACSVTKGAAYNEKHMIFTATGSFRLCSCLVFGGSATVAKVVSFMISDKYKNIVGQIFESYPKR